MCAPISLRCVAASTRAATETATLALSTPTQWGRYIVVRVTDGAEQVQEFHPPTRVHWRNAEEWTTALKEIAEQFRRRGYRIVYAESAM